MATLRRRIVWCCRPFEGSGALGDRGLGTKLDEGVAILHCGGTWSQVKVKGRHTEPVIIVWSRSQNLLGIYNSRSRSWI